MSNACKYKMSATGKMVNGLKSFSSQDCVESEIFKLNVKLNLPIVIKTC